jgi:UDP:flavonoid glycosyltransferase YjiC (YdhE family)
MCEANLVPLTPTREFASFISPWLKAGKGSVLNWASHIVAEQVLWQSARGIVNGRRRSERGLEPLPLFGFRRESDRERRPHIYAFSPSLVSRPGDWAPWIHVTGFWLLPTPDDWTPPEDLSRFLAAGAAPVAIGFGSTGLDRPQEQTRMIVEAIQKAGQRAVLLSGWGGLGGVQLPESVHAAGFVPYRWLFPQCAAVVHHAGVGTLAEALLAGLPSVVMPVAADQHFWATRAHELGVASKPIKPMAATPEEIARAVTDVSTDDGMRQRSKRLGERIATERGVDRAIEILLPYLRRVGGLNARLP